MHLSKKIHEEFGLPVPSSRSVNGGRRDSQRKLWEASLLFSTI